MKMEILKNDLLPAAAMSLLSTKVPEISDSNNTKDKGDELLFTDEIEEDEELFLRLSDDEEVKQDSTSGEIENLQLEKLDTNEDDCNSNKVIAFSSPDNSTLHLAEFTELVDEDSAGNSNLDEKGVTDNCNINDEDSTMSGSDRIPPLMHNSPKYWSNSFDKRWKGVNSSRGRHHYSHRSSNDWYNQQYPEKDKFNGRNNYNNQNKHFNQQRNSKGKYNSQTRDREIKNSEKEKEAEIEKEKSSSLKANLSDVDDIINDMNQIIEGNGNCNESKLKENNCNAENEKICVKEVDNSKEHSDKKENECNSNEERLSDEKSTDSDNLKHINSECEPTDCKKDVLSVTKDCDTTASALEKSKPESESISVNVENKFSSSVLEKSNDDRKDLSNVNETTSHDNETKRTEDENNSLEDQMNEHEKTKDEDTDRGDLHDVQDVRKIDSEKSIHEVKEPSSSTNEGNEEKLNTNKDIQENSSFSLNEKSIDISELDILESEHNESKNKSDATTDDINATTEAGKNGEPSNSISAADFKRCDTEESKSLTDKDEEGSSEMSPLVIDESSQEEKMSLVEDEEETNESRKQSEQKSSVDNNEKSSSVEVSAPEKMTGVIEEVDLVDNESETTGSTSDNQTETNSLENKNKADNLLANNASQSVPISTDSNKNTESNGEERTIVSKRRRRKRHNTLDDISMNELPVENGVRQKRRSARNAEEMIRKEILKDDEEDASSDEPSRMVAVNYKKAVLQAPPLSPPSLKRTADELEDASDSAAIKRLKATSEIPMTPAAPSPSKEFVPVSKESSTEVKDLVRRVSTEDIRGKLKKLAQEEVEALLLQKTIECITIRGEMGKLREQARQAKLNHEAARSKCQQLQKQVEGFEMVLKRITLDKNSNSDKFVPPIKITRSVGLQVNFVSAMKPGVGSASSASKTASPAAGTAAMDNRTVNQNSRKMMKTRSPRRVDMPNNGVVQSPNPVSVAATATTVGGPGAPATIVMNKPADATCKRTITLPSSANIVQLMSGQQSVVVNSTVGGSPSRPATITLSRPNVQQNKANSSDLIDLTDEEDKSKSPAVTPITTTITRPRVLQAFPASVALTNTTNLRLVQAGNQGTPTSIVNNVNAPRLTTYHLMQSGTNGVPRQLVLANPNAIRPVTSVPTRNISTISYKGVPTITSGGTVRVLTTQAPTANVQISRHPAPLPDTPTVDPNPLWKLAPPAPSLKISKVATGIVLSWNMDLTNNKYAEIVSYQLYAYQEVAGTSPSAALWKKVGDVRALPLPMACTLTQFSEGNNYYFAVRAVDIHSRFGQYSKPGNISL